MNDSKYTKKSDEILDELFNKIKVIKLILNILVFEVWTQGASQINYYYFKVIPNLTHQYVTFLPPHMLKKIISSENNKLWEKNYFRMKHLILTLKKKMKKMKRVKMKVRRREESIKRKKRSTRRIKRRRRKDPDEVKVRKRKSPG